MDRLSEEHRSWNMSRIRGKDTKPELIVRSMLHRMGYRFRLHVKDLPGKPDIVLPKYRTVIFVHGCFWHRHTGCRLTYTPNSNVAFWNAKFAATTRHDTLVRQHLVLHDWFVATIWECETTHTDRLAIAIKTQLARAGRGIVKLCD